MKSLMKLKIATVLLGPALMLTACEEEAVVNETSETGGQASGEVLTGTISDDMIALEELTSTSPPAEPTPAANTGSASASANAPTPDESAQEPSDAEPAGPAVAEPLPSAPPLETAPPQQ